ncbi:hypothetical protein ABT294_00690 [Nonomuraea sp. NPDC000554]|uniref:hypothetical protein n=1 Tax=Nonomuraea sp. NPDC000554 TaxID=3154259 RepID=UPI0033277838
MPEIPEEAVQAATAAMVGVYRGAVAESWTVHDEEAGRAAVEAAAPILAAQVRREVAAELQRAAQGRREYDKGEPSTPMHEALVTEAATFETAARLVEDPMVMLGLIPLWMWTAEEEARLDSEPPARQIGEARA